MLSAHTRLLVAFMAFTVAAGCSSNIRFVRAPQPVAARQGATGFAPLLPDEGTILVVGLAATRTVDEERVWLVRKFDDIMVCVSGVGPPRCTRARVEGASKPVFFATFVSPDGLRTKTETSELGSSLQRVVTVEDSRSFVSTPGDAGVWMLSVGLFRCTSGKESRCHQMYYQGGPLEPRILAHRSAKGPGGVVLDELWVNSWSDNQLILCTQRGPSPPSCVAATMEGAPVVGAYETAAALPSSDIAGHALWVWAAAGLLRCAPTPDGAECKAARFDAP